ncbi:MAG: hypothetical protein VX078_05380 [Pseudomonadota bacterium]|nr:hypothetical protein [Pseudomonadota bacterium]|tara:strand:+ start:735 stop:1370 length:636 start_codon:yes stop_codon:yes gene_type:complete
MAQLRRDNVFRLQRSLFYWDKSFDAPFVHLIYKKLKAYVENKFPDLDWDEELKLAREDFWHVKTWGNLETGLEKSRLVIDVKGQKINIQVSKMMWCLLYPDYLLITYPLWPPGKQKTMDSETLNWANPMFHYPSRYWHLPAHVYSYFESVYGERRPEEIKGDRYQKYLVKRSEYCQYFARKYRLPLNHFEAVTGTRVQARHHDLKTILALY